MGDLVASAIVNAPVVGTSWSPPVIIVLKGSYHGRLCSCSKYTHTHAAWFELRSRPYDVVTDAGDENGENCQPLYTRLKGPQASSWVCPDRLLRILYDPRWRGQCRPLGEPSPWLSMVLPTTVTPIIENA